MNNLVKNLHSNLEFRRTLDRIAEAKEEWGILIVGIDGFKRINNLYSYSFGDKVLEDFANKAEGILKSGIQLYKLDGDCFGILSQGAPENELTDYFEALSYLAKNDIVIDETGISLTISGGIAFSPMDGSDGEALYKNVRIALIESKEQGGCRCTVLSRELLDKVEFSMNLLESIKESVNNGFEGFELSYQPLILSQSGDLYGCEVLLRWHHELFPMGVSPYEFIPILENYGMIIDVGNWVLENSLIQLSQWAEIMPNFQMSINVSSIQFENPYFKHSFLEMLSKYRIDPNLVTLELTESGQISNVEYVGEIFDFLRSQGIKIAFDDFGTGYASLEIFRVLSADELKIDRSFLNRISYDVTDQKIISQLIQLCNSMNMFVCVEGIETKEIEHIARQLEPKLLQGYYYNKPLTAQEFEDYYFFKLGDSFNEPFTKLEKSHEPSMVYSEYRPAKPMAMDEIIDNAYAGIFQVGMDREFTFLTCNEGYRRMLGYTAAEINAKFRNSALGFVHPDDMEYVSEEIRRQLGLGDTITIEFRVVRSDGSPLWIVGTGNVVKGKSGNSSLVVVIIANNEAKLKSLRTASDNALYQKILSRIPTGIKYVHFDEDFTIDFISDGFLSIIGYTRSEIDTIFDGKYVNMVYHEDREKVINDVLEQTKLGNIVVLHYRTMCKNGNLIWVETVSCLYPPDEDGIQRCCSSVVNVTETISEEKKQHAISLAARYQHAATLWGDVIFEYTFATKHLTCSDNFVSVFGRPPSDNMAVEIEAVHVDDREVIARALKEIYECKNTDVISIEVRIMNGNGEYIWCSVVYNQPDMLGNVPVSVIGKICKIDDEVQKQQELLKKLQLDPLTGLLNKSAIEHSANQILTSVAKEIQHVLFIIDIDDFKRINSLNGHGIGDSTLKVLARRLQSIFKARDLLARSGGDEFMVFAEFCDNRLAIENKCTRVLQALEEPIKIGDKLLTISASMGVSIAKSPNVKFFDLFSQANASLYRAKEMGKNQYSIT